MVKIKSKEIVLDAKQYVGSNKQEIWDFVGLNNSKANYDDPETLLIWNHLEKVWLPVRIGAWVIKGLKDEFYPCDNEVLQAKYNIEEEDPDPTEEYKGWGSLGITTGKKELAERIAEYGLTVEQLIIEIAHLGGYIKIGVDQWWGFWVDGYIENYETDTGLNFKTFIQADFFEDGLIKTFEVWKAKWEELNGREWKIYRG